MRRILVSITIITIICIMTDSHVEAQFEQCMLISRVALPNIAFTVIEDSDPEEKDTSHCLPILFMVVLIPSG